MRLMTGEVRRGTFESMCDALFSTPPPKNEPVLGYAPGSPERARLKETLSRMSAETIEIPLFIGGREMTTGTLGDVRAPHEHDLLLARCHLGGAKEAEHAVIAVLGAWPAWSSTTFAERAANVV